MELCGSSCGNPVCVLRKETNFLHVEEWAFFSALQNKQINRRHTGLLAGIQKEKQLRYDIEQF